MPDEEDILREQTHKGDGLSVKKRVFYTLQDRKDTQAYRNSKLLALLVEKLVEENILSDDEIDEFLIQVVS